MPYKKVNNNKRSDTSVSSHKQTPRQLRRDIINRRERLASILHCLCGYTQSEAYATAFDFRGSHTSLGPIASRFFSSPKIHAAAQLFVRYYDGVPYHINTKYVVD